MTTERNVSMLVDRLLEAEDLDDVKDFLHRNSEPMNEFMVSAISRQEGDKWLLKVVPFGWIQLRNLRQFPYDVKHYVATFRRENIPDILDQVRKNILNRRQFMDFRVERASSLEFRKQ